jgi:hypothetical protein
MNLAEVMDEVGHAMQAITGLRVQAFPGQTVSAPAGYVSYPTQVAYDQTYGRGVDQIDDLEITLLIGNPYTRQARDQVAQWAAGSGPMSVKQAVEAWQWTTCDDVTITTCEFEGLTVEGVLYLAVTFKATVVGPGEGP